jgi:hypothetical protein
MTDDAVTVSLSLDQWQMVQEALDEYLYVVEHSPAGGIRPATKERYRQRRHHLMKSIPEVAGSLSRQTGLEPL